MKKTFLLLIGFLIVKLILQYFLIDPYYDLQRDEYLHLDQGKHLAWGYISVPPMTSWMSYIINMLGGGVFWVKFFPAFFGTLTILVVWKIIEELNGRWFALLLGSLAVLLSVILRLNILFQPNSSDVFFWTLTYYTTIKYINTNENKWLYITGLSVGLGFLSKYNIVFLVLGLLGGLLLTRQRKILINKHLYLAAFVTLIIVLPNLLWQINNHFPTFHQLNELAATQLVNVNRSDFIKDQFLFFVNSIFVVIAAVAGFFFYPAFRKYFFVFLSYLIILAFYIFLKAKSYYAIGLYPVLLAFGSVYLERLLDDGWKKYLRPVFPALVIILFIPILWLAFPIKSPAEIEAHNEPYQKLGLLKWEDGKDHSLPQDFADMTGWSGLARKVDSIYRQLPDKENTLVYCDNYGQAGAINYYSAFKNINAVSMNADYINWFRLQTPVKDVIMVKDVYDDDSSRTKEKPLFDSVLLVGKNDNPYSREFGTRIYLLKGAKMNVNPLLQQEISERKNYQ
jgi:hypothetical protein